MPSSPYSSVSLRVGLAENHGNSSSISVYVAFNISVGVVSMRQQQLEWFRQRIFNVMEEQREKRDSLRETAFERSLSESVGELSSLDQHTSDLGNETMERSKDMGLLAQADDVLSACNHALERIAAGTYGTCERCGRSIPEARLEAIPYTTMCVDCSEEMTGQRERPMRPIEEEANPFPFNEADDLGDEDYQIDRDDTWEIVARHGTANSPQDAPEEFDPDDDDEEKGNG